MMVEGHCGKRQGAPALCYYSSNIKPRSPHRQYHPPLCSQSLKEVSSSGTYSKPWQVQMSLHQRACQCLSGQRGLLAVLVSFTGGGNSSWKTSFTEHSDKKGKLCNPIRLDYNKDRALVKRDVLQYHATEISALLPLLEITPVYFP